MDEALLKTVAKAVMAEMVNEPLGHDWAEADRYSDPSSETAFAIARAIIPIVGEAVIGLITNYARDMNGKSREATFSDLPAIIRAATGAGE